MRFVLALLALLLPGAAFASCPAILTDCPSPSMNNLTVNTINGLPPGTGGGGGDLTSPGPIGSTTPNTIAGTQMAANSLVIGSPAGGNMGAGTLNVPVGLFFIDGVPFGVATTITITRKSGTITVGAATNQIAIAANPNRASCRLQPQTSDMYINIAGGATTLDNNSEFMPAMSEFTCPAGYKGAVGIAGITTGALFYADEGTVP